MADPRTSAPPFELYLEGWDLRRDAANLTRGKHWSTRSKRAKLARDYVFAAIRSRYADLHPTLPFSCRVSVQFTRYMGPRQRALDPDNATASVKPLLDALVRNGVLRGDTSKHVELPPVRFVGHREPGARREGVRIEITQKEN